jgi:hypothetical protein
LSDRSVVLVFEHFVSFSKNNLHRKKFLCTDEILIYYSNNT